MFKAIRLAQNSFDLMPYYIGAFTLSNDMRAQLLNLIHEQEYRLKAARLYKKQQRLQSLAERNEERLKIVRLKAEIFRKLA